MRRHPVPALALSLLLAACATDPLQGAATLTPDASGTPDAPGDDGGVTGDAPVAVPLELGPGVTIRPPAPAAGQPLTLEYRGALAGAASVHVHYGFNGWNDLQGAGLRSADDGTGNLDYFDERALSAMPGGGWEITIPLPAGARALHLAFFSESGGQRTWDAADGGNYNAGFPLVLYGPVLTWDGSVRPQDGVVVNFHTGWPCKGRVTFGEGTAFDKSVVESEASRSHFVRLSGLRAATSYSYRVGCDAISDPPSRTFRTAGEADTKFSFLVMGDMQDTGEAGRWKRTADAAATNHGGAAFILMTGDLPWNDKPGLWWTFFDQGRDLLGSHVMVPAKGNHDINQGVSTPGQTTMERLLALDGASGSKTRYVVRYGSAAIVVLDSQRPDGFAQSGGEQFAWTSQRLGAAPVSDATWVFAAWHVPPYNVGTRHWQEQGTFRDMTSLFDGKVDWVFCGHEHMYQRMRPLRFSGTIAASGKYGRGASDGVGYLVVPAAGAWPEAGLIPTSDPKAYTRDRLAYPVVPSGTDTGPTENGYTAVSIDGATIDLATWGVGKADAPVAPHVVDRVTYTR